MDSNVATISITVAPVNDAPVASIGTLSTPEDTPATGTLVATDIDVPSPQITTAFALSGTNLVSFDINAPTITQTTAIANITAGETLVGIDFRPQNGMLYGLGVNATADNATLYAISTLEITWARVLAAPSASSSGSSELRVQSAIGTGVDAIA